MRSAPRIRRKDARHAFSVGKRATARSKIPGLARGDSHFDAEPLQSIVERRALNPQACARLRPCCRCTDRAPRRACDVRGRRAGPEDRWAAGRVLAGVGRRLAAEASSARGTKRRDDVALAEEDSALDHVWRARRRCRASDRPRARRWPRRASARAGRPYFMALRTSSRLAMAGDRRRRGRAAAGSPCASLQARGERRRAEETRRGLARRHQKAHVARNRSRLLRAARCPSSSARPRRVITSAEPRRQLGENERAAVRELEHARRAASSLRRRRLFPSRKAHVRAPRRAESRAGDHDERLRFARRAHVQRAREELFLGPWLARDEHRDAPDAASCSILATASRMAGLSAPSSPKSIGLRCSASR